MSTSLTPNKEVFSTKIISETPLPTPSWADEEKIDESEYMNDEANEKDENSPNLRPRPTPNGPNGDISKKGGEVSKKK